MSNRDSFALGRRVLSQERPGQQLMGTAPRPSCCFSLVLACRLLLPLQPPQLSSTAATVATCLLQSNELQRAQRADKTLSGRCQRAPRGSGTQEPPARAPPALGESRAGGAGCG